MLEDLPRVQSVRSDSFWKPTYFAREGKMPTTKELDDFIQKNTATGLLGIYEYDPTNNTYTGNTQENIYTITGSLFIPGLYGDTIKALPKLKSIDALKKIAQDLKLGFATNEESTDDEMTWINPNTTVANFIKNITDRAYKNENSFFIGNSIQRKMAK
jgi:hypothetical protein